MVGELGIGLVRGAVDQVQVQAILALGDQNAFMRQRDARIGRIGNVGQKNAFPNRGALRRVHVLHVEHELGKAFIETRAAAPQKKPASL